MSKRHPAKFASSVLSAIENAWPEWASGTILDPFAGTGRVHELADRLGLDSVGVELEPEWAMQHPRTIIGDALALPFPRASFGAVVTSPCYGNRMADCHDARDACKSCNGGCNRCEGTGLSYRSTYRHALGRPLSAGSAAGLQWGEKYRNFHFLAWAEVYRVLKPGGLFVLNMSDHIRNGERQRVTDWHVGVIEEIGFVEVDRHHVETPRLRRGANAHLRVPYESVIFFRRHN